ncbi:hypothetical protein HZF24_16265 [Sedimentibacter hydroxybenzoicus DSM 7310]|uniref:Uncharacterized protein n=1 Tax=Sedimentibacter hydroxybenzoicus DSM 7310 TaxID=1123245 RepID=A0A974BLR5_SEDHY|nr:hypothetical protein [Sedimentibacter hydroxybenzoicus]NYB75704.1 hypothetical protein [Sedimentibacter hydroxybenzoicus DSM 7310]
MGDILNSFVDVAPYINELTNTDFAVSVCDLEKCLIYVPSKRQDHNIRKGVPHIKGSVNYESVITGRRVVRRVGPEVFGFPYIAIAIPIRDNAGKIIGSVSFTEAVDKQDLMLALADNLHATVQQLVSMTETISFNSKKLKELGRDLNEYVKNTEINISEKLDEILNISLFQIEVSSFISKLAIDLNDRAEKLKENAKLLSKED